MTQTDPTRVRLYAFNVGFGDCFLLRFFYADRLRHVLIDFGTMRAPPDAEPDLQVRIAEDIEKICAKGDGLDLLIVTHRHQDHISGFATKDGAGPGDIIKRLTPKLVLQPWTEDPDAARDGGEAMRGFRAQLDDMGNVAAAAHRFASARKSASPRNAQLAFLGEDNLKNKSAVENLIAMSANKRGRYLKFGDKVDLTTILPGVKIHVLGPPSPQDWPAVKRQAANVAGEYWIGRARTSKRIDDAGLGQPLFPSAPLPTYARWVAERAEQAEAESFHTIVRALDGAMNNTSLILLFEAGQKKLLFPGDAQWENWSYALSKHKIVALLNEVDLYKVGHHGSRNATPKTLWDSFTKRGDETKPDRLRSIMSTLHGVHGETAQTRVPRGTLVSALKQDTKLLSTENAPQRYIYCDLNL